MRTIELPFKNSVQFSNYQEAKTDEEVIKFCDQTKDFKIIGEGYNTLIVNDKINKPVLKIIKKGISKISSNKRSILKINAGESWNDVVEYSVKHNLGGIENLTDIPGSAGAAPIQNIGAYGVELSNVLKSCTVYDVKKRQIKKLYKLDCKFGYRDSIFKQDPGRYIILSIDLELINGPYHNLNLQYPDVKRTIDELNISNPTILDCRNIISEIRKSKLPPMDKGIGSAGSFFKNPIISKTKLEQLLKVNKNLKWFELESEEIVKVSAANLIETSGLKNYKINGVGTYKNQPLVIVNLSSCNGKSIWDFSLFIIHRVKEVYGIELIPEVNIWNEK